MSRPSNELIRAFMKDLVKLQKEHDLWLEADENCKLSVSNSDMGEFIEMWWEGEELIAELEPDRLTTEEEKNET